MITKKDLTQFLIDNCYVDSQGRIEWTWKEDTGSQSSKEINKKIVLLLTKGKK